jgi:hypothetical protein
MRRLFLIISLLALLTPVRSMAQDDSVVDGYRHFIMPTGKPIEGGYFGFWELAFLTGGYGFGDVLSVSGGFTVLPTVSVHSQFGYLQAKLTLYDDQGFSVAAGANLLALTTDNTLLHLFGALTYELPNQTRFTGLLFYKIYGNTPQGANTTLVTVNVVPYGAFTFNYTGGLGAGLGFDTPLSNNKNVRFVAEAWSHDLTEPTAFAVLGALRLESQNFSSDFGFMFFTLPLLVPVANFVWRF